MARPAQVLIYFYCKSLQLESYVGLESRKMRGGVAGWWVTKCRVFGWANVTQRHFFFPPQEGISTCLIVMVFWYWMLILGKLMTSLWGLGSYKSMFHLLSTSCLGIRVGLPFPPKTFNEENAWGFSRNFIKFKPQNCSRKRNSKDNLGEVWGLASESSSGFAHIQNSWIEKTMKKKKSYNGMPVNQCKYDQGGGLEICDAFLASSEPV